MVVSSELVARLADFEIDPGNDELPAPIVEASEKIAAIYADLLSRGVEDEMIARSMMGATISFYDGLGLAAVLPNVLRTVADKVERELASPARRDHH